MDITVVESAEGPNPAVLAMVQRQWPDANVIGAKRGTEQVLEVGQVVFVVGPARAVGQGGDEYRGSRRLVVGAGADPTVPVAVHAGDARQALGQTKRMVGLTTGLAIGCPLVIAALVIGHC